MGKLSTVKTAWQHLPKETQQRIVRKGKRLLRKATSR